MRNDNKLIVAGPETDEQDDHAADVGAAVESVRNNEIEDLLRDYRITRTINETPVSVVYKAEEIKTRRRVALKVVFNRSVPDPLRINRARADIVQLRRLMHPGIAPILDAGTTERGHCYFISEFVKGVSLDEYMNIHKLSLDDRLAIFTKVCDAMNHAHQHCVLHRDLRPSNVVIDGKCNPRIVGFGIATVTDVDVGLHKSGIGVKEMREFLLYKSPEQVSGRIEEIDVRSDVYSLGVIFYTLMTDRMPYSGQLEKSRDIIRAICEEMPSKPGSVKASLRGDLEAIILRAIEKEAHARYPNVYALGQDLENYFDQRPVKARRAGAIYEFRKFTSRYRSRTLSVVFMSLAMLAFGLHVHHTTRKTNQQLLEQVRVLAAAEAAQLRTSREAALAAQFRAQKQLEQERERSQDVEIQATDLQQQLVDAARREAELQEALEAARDQARVREEAREFLVGMFSKAGSGENRDQLASLLQPAADKAANDHERPALRGIVCGDLAALFQAMGQHDKAVEMSQAALEARELTLGVEHADTIAAKNQLASSLFALGRLADAEPLCRDLAEVARRSFGEDDPRTLTAMNNLGMTLYGLGELEKAGEVLQNCVDGRRRRLGAAHPKTVATLQSLALVLFDRGLFAEAEGAYSEVQDKLPPEADGSEHLSLEVSSRRGACLTELRRFEEAEPLLQQSFDGMSAAYGRSSVPAQEALRRLIRLYEVWQKPDKLGQYRAMFVK